jgi:hypothetical protein
MVGTKSAYLSGVSLYHRIADADLTVTGNDDLIALADGENCCSVKNGDPQINVRVTEYGAKYSHRELVSKGAPHCVCPIVDVVRSTGLEKPHLRCKTFI